MGTREQRADLQLWLEGWSEALAEINYLRTGLPTSSGCSTCTSSPTRTSRADESYAVKIGAVTDPARPLTM